MRRMITNIIFFLVVFLVAGGILLLAYFANQKFEEAAIERQIAESQLELILRELRKNTELLKSLNDDIFTIGETVEAMHKEKDDEVEAADPTPTPSPTPIPDTNVWIDFDGNGILVNGNIKITFDESFTTCDMSFERDIRMMKYYICNNTKRRKAQFSIVKAEMLYGKHYNGRDYILDESRAKAYRLAGDLYLIIAMPDEPWCKDDWQEECDYWLTLLDVECG